MLWPHNMDKITNVRVDDELWELSIMADKHVHII